MIIGLTGQTGAGKSTVCSILREKGFYICDCDKVAKEVRDDPLIAEKLAECFGRDIIADDGLIDRKKLAERAFSTAENTQLLNSITHPEIISRCTAEMNCALADGYEVAVLDAPALFESGADEICDKIISVIASEKTRLQRILDRDGITPEEAAARMNAQKQDSFYTEKSDYVIYNNGNFEDLCKEVGKFLNGGNKYE